MHLKKVVDGVAITSLRKYIANRIGLKPEKGKEHELMERVSEFIEKLNKMEDTDLWKYASEKEKRIAKKLAKKYPEFLKYLTPQNVLKWLMYDCPIAFGILVAHPHGLNWLEEVIANLHKHLLDVDKENIELILEEAEE